MSSGRLGGTACLVGSTVALVGCGSDHPTVQAVRPEMERAVATAVTALGSTPRPSAVLSARCGPDDLGVDGDRLQVEQPGLALPADLPSRREAVVRELARLGLTEGSAQGYSPAPLLLVQPEERGWTLVVTTAAGGGLVVSATAVVDEDDVPGDLLPRNGC